MRAEFEIPTTLPSVANLREHWGAKARRTKKLRRDARVVCAAFTPWHAIAAVRAFGARITLTRVAKRRYDQDNLSAAFKPIQDGIADALGMNDGSRLLEWVYADEAGQTDLVRVTIEERLPAAGGGDV